MIKFDLLKVGKWGMIICGLAFIVGMVILMFFLPDGEASFGWILIVGYPTVAAKTGFIISFFVWVIGLFLNQKKPE